MTEGYRDEHEETDEMAESEDLPAEVVDEAERLTRLARDAVDESEAEAYRDRRETLLAEYDFRSRVREDDSRDVLVFHPDEWLEDGIVQMEKVEDTDRGIERPLSGAGEAGDWETVAEHNQRVADRVTDEHGPVHGANAESFAEFMGNHYARRVESVTDEERTEFLTEYFPRNAWPSDEQRDAVEESVRLVVAVGESLSGASE